MGIYIFNWDILKQYLIEDEEDLTRKMTLATTSSQTCCVTAAGCTLIISAATGRMWEPFPPCGEANMEVLDPEHSGINLFDENWKSTAATAV